MTFSGWMWWKPARSVNSLTARTSASVSSSILASEPSEAIFPAT